MASATLERVVWSEKSVSVCGRQVRMAVAGSGRPIIVLPRDQGHPPQNRFLDQLAGLGEVHHPWLAGFHGGNPEEWAWLKNVRDLAVVHRLMIEALRLERPTLVGLGFGGWLAAEIATMTPNIGSLVLVSPMGIKPANGYIYDQFIVSTEQYVQTGFHDKVTFSELYGPETSLEQLESWETDREMASRLAWKPYMYNPVLPQLLSGLSIPAFVVWGDDDEVVPVECAQAYKAALSNSSLELISNCGHVIELERPDELLRSVASFLAQP